MNNTLQPQSNNQMDDNTAKSDPVFQVDLSGLKDRAPTNEPTTISLSPETGPVTIENLVKEPKVEDVKIEFGNEAIKSIEKGSELQTEKLEQAVDTTSRDNSVIVPIQTPKAEVKIDEGEKKEPVKYKGYPIDESLLNDVEKVKKEKGKGDPNEGLSAILIFLDRLFRIRDKVK